MALFPDVRQKVVESAAELHEKRQAKFREQLERELAQVLHCIRGSSSKEVVSDEVPDLLTTCSDRRALTLIAQHMHVCTRSGRRTLERSSPSRSGSDSDSLRSAAWAGRACSCARSWRTPPLRSAPGTTGV